MATEKTLEMLLQEVGQAWKEHREAMRYTYAFRHTLFGTKVFLDIGEPQLYATGAEARAAGIELFNSLEADTRKAVELVELRCSPGASAWTVHWYYSDTEFWWPDAVVEVGDGTFCNTRSLDKMQF